MIEAQVDAKKEKLLQCLCKILELLRDKVVCLCTVCSVLPIMTRYVVAGKGTAHTHCQMDVKKGLIAKAELQAANGTNLETWLPYGDYFC